MSLFDFDKQIFNTEKTEDGLTVTHFRSIDGRHVSVNIKCEGFLIERTFLNNYDGNLELKSFLSEVRTKEDLLKKLGVTK
jgi:hypothetical protein